MSCNNEHLAMFSPRLLASAHKIDCSERTILSSHSLQNHLLDQTHLKWTISSKDTCVTPLIAMLMTSSSAFRRLACAKICSRHWDCTSLRRCRNENDHFLARSYSQQTIHWIGDNTLHCDPNIAVNCLKGFNDTRMDL